MTMENLVSTVDSTPWALPPSKDLSALEAHSLAVLEWPKLSLALQQRCASVMGQSYWASPHFWTDVDWLRERQAQVDALRQVGDRDRWSQPTVWPLPHLQNLLAEIRLKRVFSAPTLGQLLATLTAATHWVKDVRAAWQHAGRPKALLPFFESLTLPEAVLASLSESISPTGEVLDSASPALAAARQRLRDQDTRIGETLHNLMQSATVQPMLQERLLMERDGRTVIPIQASYKNVFEGLVHDVSASGSTVYMEPAVVVPLNNARRETHATIEAEISRICEALSKTLHTHTEALRAFWEQTGWLDVTWAAAHLAADMAAHVMTLTDEQTVSLNNVRHPLLALGEAPVVANTLGMGAGLNLSEPIKTLIITGPNTGGKTVLLKTLGLCAWMLRAGLLLPCEPDSTLGVFHPIVCELGDGQDLSQNLSTFSGHMGALAQWLQLPLQHGLVLVDELASGTDPVEGAALAQAILETLHNAGATSVITTHLGRLKETAAHHAGFANASMLFDAETLAPTYQLMMGIPGASHAITIAQRLGVDSKVIERANALLSTRDVETAALLQQLAQARQQLLSDEAALKALERTLEQRDADSKAAEERLQQKRFEFAHDIQKRIRNHLQQLEVEVQTTRQRLRATENERDLTHREQWNSRLKKRGNKLIGDAFNALNDATEATLTMADVAVGQVVNSRKLGMSGPIISLQPNQGTVTLQAGLAQVTLDLSDIQILASSSAIKKRKPKRAGDSLQRRLNKPNPHSPNIAPADTEWSAKDAFATAECKLLGLRVEEALEAMSEFLNTAMLENHQTVAIIHGMGTGALKKAVREALKHSPLVAAFGGAQAIHGGEGKTLVLLK
ncbi:MAG: Smr/MutS family protein [Vampirovibrionales bacterium]|nr:Smr/MutS family protein [Vampirovibrionales bacterium]